MFDYFFKKGYYNLKIGKYFKLILSKYEIIMTGCWSKYQNWEIQLSRDLSNWSSFCFSIGKIKRPNDDIVFGFNFELLHIYFSFIINDYRLWDNYNDKQVTLEEYEKLENQKRIGKPKYKYRKRYEKWFYTSQFLKIYNFDYLNDPCGKTIDIALFPFFIYLTFQYGISPRYSFDLTCNLKLNNKMPYFNFQIVLFSLLLKFEIGKNTVIREANLKYVDDFNTLIMRGANPYIEDCNNILEEQIIRKNLAYVWQILDSTDITKFNTDEIIKIALDDFYYNDDIFDLLLKNINNFNSFNDVGNITGYNKKGIEKLYEKYKNKK